jgi:Trk K+ transport system NAD-binding subunit
MQLTVDTFGAEIAEALKNYDRYVVCIDKTPDECEDSLRRLMEKAIKAYDNRGPGLRHGIALDRQVTIILSQTDTSDRPMCGIYFNLSSPYHRQQRQSVAEKQA